MWNLNNYLIGTPIPDGEPYFCKKNKIIGKEATATLSRAHKKRAQKTPCFPAKPKTGCITLLAKELPTT